MSESQTQSAAADPAAPGMPPGEMSPRTGWLIALGVMAAVMVVGVAVVRLVDPIGRGAAPPCVFYETTGWHCPGCGATRMVHAMAHGEVAAAFGHNPLLFVALTGTVAFCSVMAIGGWRWRTVSRFVPTWAYWGLGLVIVGYGIARNLPWEPLAWLSP